MGCNLFSQITAHFYFYLKMSYSISGITYYLKPFESAYRTYNDVFFSDCRHRKTLLICVPILRNLQVLWSKL